MKVDQIPQRLCHLLVVALVLCSPAYAYVDPGVGGMLLQLGYVVFYGLLGALAFLGRPFMMLFGKKKKKGDDSSPHEDGGQEKAPEEDSTSSEAQQDGEQA